MLCLGALGVRTSQADFTQRREAQAGGLFWPEGHSVVFPAQATLRRPGALQSRTAEYSPRQFPSLTVGLVALDAYASPADTRGDLTGGAQP